MTIVYQPPTEHHCGPNEYGLWLEHIYVTPGTLDMCEECGTMWVAKRPSVVGFCGVYWVKESRFTRWRRERKQA